MSSTLIPRSTKDSEVIGSSAEQRFDAAIEQAGVDARLHRIEHGVDESYQSISGRHGAIDMSVGGMVENREMVIDRAAQIGLAGHVAVVDEADPAIERVERPERMFEEWLAGRRQNQRVDAAVEAVEFGERQRISFL